MPIDIRALMQHGYKVASGIIRSGEEAMTVFLAERGDGHLAIYVAPRGNEAQKDIMIRSLRLVFAARGVTKYVMCGEVWTVERKTLGELGDRKPSECEDKQEKLFLLGVTPDETVVAHADLDRAADGARSVGELVWDSDADRIGGRMAELLPDSRISAAPPDIADALEAALGFKAQPTSVH